MSISSYATIAGDMLTHYLLIFRQRNDKSGLLTRVGFTQENPDHLDRAIRRHATENDAMIDRGDEYGRFYRVEGELVEPSGTLDVVTVWIEPSAGEFRFVTLKPVR